MERALRGASFVEHRGGYREAARPDVCAPEPTLGDPRPALEAIRGALRRQLAWGTIVALAVTAIVARGGGAVRAIAAGGALLLVSLLARRVTIAHERALRVATGQLVLHRGRWRFVDGAGAAYAVHPHASRWLVGPARALVHPELGAAVAIATPARTEDEEAAARQATLDAFFGVTRDDRDALAEGRVPPHLRARLLRPWRVATATLGALSLASPLVGPRAFVLGALLALIAWGFVWHDPAAAIAREGVACSETGPVTLRARLNANGQYVLDLVVRARDLRPLHLCTAAQRIVAPGQVVRAYVVAGSDVVLAAEHVASPIAFEHPWIPPNVERALDDFRSALH